MADNLTLDGLTNLTNSSAVTKINANFTKIENQFDDVLYRNGREELTADFDANGHRILNLPDAVYPGDPLPLRQISTINNTLSATVSAYALAAANSAITAENFALALEVITAGGWYDSLAAGAAAVAEGEGYFVKDSTNSFYTAQKVGGVGVKGAEFSTTALLGTTYLNAYPATAYGAIGNGTTDDTAALQAILNLGVDLYLPYGKTFKTTSALTMTTSFQRIGGPGKLKPVGSFDCVSVSGGSVGVEIDIAVESATHTGGYAIKIANANRVRIRRLNGIDVYGGLYVEQANSVTVDWMWSTCRGPGIVWYGDDTKRSDLLMLLNCIVRPGVGFYGLDWNGNCNSLVVKYLGIVCGSSVGAGNAKGAVIRNTAGITTFPAIGRFTHIDVDYPTGPGLEILSGLDYDLATPYILGSNSDGIKIGALINDYEVRLTGGKSTGNTGWGVNNLGGVVLTSGSTSFNSNTAGETTGNVWTRTPRIHLDTNAYYTISGVSPLLSFDLNDYISYDRTNNVYGSYIGGVAIQSIRATYVQAHKPLVHPAYTVATLPTGVQWMRAFVSDATVTTFNSVVAGGGTNKVPVFYDGAAWRIG